MLFYAIHPLAVCDAGHHISNSCRPAVTHAIGWLRKIVASLIDLRVRQGVPAISVARCVRITVGTQEEMEKFQAPFQKVMKG